jgi:hypothetical protein
MYIFTIYDQISEKAGNIFTTSTIGEAERQFIDALRNAQEGSLFRTHPQDFELVLLGSFDEDKVSITDTKKQIITTGKKAIPSEGVAA